MVIFNIEENFKEEKEWKINEYYSWILLESTEVSKIAPMFSNECIKECLDYKQSPRIDFYKDYIFMVINIMENENKCIKAKEVDIFLGEKYIITVCKDCVKVLDDILIDINENKNCLLINDIKDPAIILYYILDRIIENNYNIISELEGESDRIELDILGNPKSKQLNSLLYIRREAYKIRKILKPLRYIGDTILLNENGIIKEDLMFYFKNITKKIDKLMFSLDNLSQELAMVREAYESELANKTNELMKVFTVITAIFLPLELIIAIFSMNFDYMPFKNHPCAFYGLLGGLAFVVIVLLIIFRRRKIL